MTKDDGWMAEYLCKQLQEQGVQGITEDNMRKYQKLADRISMLYLNQCMTEQQMHKDINKLSSDICKFLKTLEAKP